MQTEEAALRRKILGNWYFDVLTWTFNEDGTGVIDIPELGEQPATKREFSYSVSGDATNIFMTMDWSDSDTSYFWLTVNDSSSIILQGASDTDAIKLTRTFDASNCPVTEKIVSNAMAVFSGSIVSEILPAVSS
jgi:hypothetical protein